MLTCRLLCALLVLALCCCPSVGAADSSQVLVKDIPSPSPTQPQGTGVSGAANTSTTSSSAVPSAALPGKIEGPDTQGISGVEQALPENPSKVAAPAGSSGPASSVPITKEVPGGSGISGSPGSPGPVADTVQKNGDNDTADSKSGNNPSTEQTNTNADDSAQKTTTTTTTQAPSTTTTEASTTTTTRAASRLREIDGSLSSSAWVCAPLLPAVSALAYTTLG
ncbi:mucin TcMUCII [Trypanosoma cruzi cruzi]|uniref:Putative mucin TcMUCII n=1 Tax=Trypanosoma cruzi TaxID=5693 RepID=A0A2V2VXD5_TRYCR|nr:mucin TcMUCII [Trypanosoma cruzi cruzi]PWV01028.1 putative mucin TcMUCII [Trypanosoma cruzi]